MSRRRRGNLLVALLIAAVCTVLLFVAVGVAISPLGLSQRLDQQQVVRNAAESVIHLALAELFEQPDWGKDQKAQLSWKSPEGAEARLTFLPSDPNYCSNRLGLETPGRGSQGPVPPDSVQLIGVARLGEMRVRVLAVYHVPPFPYGVISSAPFRSGGNNLVGSLQPGQDPEDLLKTNAEDLLQPAAVASQDAGAQAIQLTSSDLVLGDVVTPGGIDAPAGSYRGKLRAGEKLKAIPSIDIDRFQPPAGVTDELEAASIASRSDKLNLSSFHHVAGSLSVPNGLTLNSAALYVDGDLDVEGGVTGKGLIVSRGKVSIHGGAQLLSQNQLALLSKGSVSLEGVGQDNNFRGLVYTEGDLKADRVQIAGVLVANSKQPGVGKIELSDTRLAADASMTFKTNWLSPQSTNFRKNVVGPAGSNQFSATTHETVEPQKDGGMKVRWNLDLDFSVIPNIPHGDWNQGATKPVGKYSGMVREDIYDREGTLVSQKKKSAAEVLRDLRADPYLAQLDMRHTTRNYRSNGGKGFYQYQTGTYSRSVNTEVDILDWIAQDAAYWVGNASPQRSGGHSLDLNLDLNQFLSLSDSLRILQWKQLPDEE